MQTVTIEGSPREQIGKRASKMNRNEGLIPAVMYGGDAPVHFTTSAMDVRSLVYSADFKIAEISVDGSMYRCILKDVQYHPVTDQIIHIDFLRLVDGSPIKVEIPIRFEGTAPGVRAGGKLMQKVRRVKIKTLPENLVDELTLNISKLKLGQSIRVRDIQPKEGIEIMNSPGIPVASVEIPRALRSATSAAEKAGVAMDSGDDEDEETPTEE